jgi:sterol desaturase/sphingolipid hydroxylase (fatty acid hydroxylase superfamily)
MHIEDILGFSLPVIYLVLYVTEKVWPARHFPQVRGWGAIGGVFLVLMMTAGVVVPLALPIDWIVEHRVFDASALGVPGGILVGFLVFELVVYAYHRACHEVSLLWRVSHQMHHAPQRLDTPGAVVFHPFELLMNNVLFIGVTLFLLGLDPLAVAGIGFLLGFCALFQHWNVRTPVWVGYLIQRPEAHCLHHELNVHAYNYADLPLWDMLFGTFRNPREFSGQVGFASRASFAQLLVGVDVNAGQNAGQPGARLVAAQS